VDTASVGQLGELCHLADKIGVSIDHHGTGEIFCPAFVDPAASAAGEILFDLYRMWQETGRIQANADIARLLYTAIVSDTGSFKYSNTTKKTMLAAAELIGEIQSATDGGDDIPMLCHRLFECRTLTELRAQRAGIDALRLEHEGELGIVLFTQAMLHDNGLTMEDIANVIGLPRTVDGVKIALAIKQSPDDPTTWRISSRANVDVDVSAVCATFGGGGHKRAAGCSIVAPDAETAAAIAIEAFGEALTQAEEIE
jgi:phosphoesterase RecJ-like protein